ncbi:PRTRC system protein B [Pseudoduganella sp. UC29_106]|uniref:PRTRC system protein B n=1 Tax=Pseudoduganella sp. UC29_106 TaxID=3374553 RepID=UPI003757C0C8
MPNTLFRIDLREAASMMLAQAVLIYRPSSAANGGAYASMHEVSLDQGRPVILAGKPITPRAALRLAQSISNSAAHAGYLPGNVLFADGDTLVWWVPAQRRHIAFRCPESTLGERSADVPHPALVFMVTGSAWMVWAHKGKKRPAPDTLLWQAPYFNVNADGVICRGNVVTPTGSTTDRISAWEDAFFRSYFTHPNVPKGLVRHRGGAYAFWREMLDQKFTHFPQGVLVPTGMTLGALVDRHARGLS